jgi:amidase
VAAERFLTQHVRAAGLTILGRTATPEFALSASTESLLNGATRNPWNPQLLAGGSSGGAAASVAAGILPLAHASDSAGSIRIPASACGLVGLKPSRGRVSMGPLEAENLGGMSQEFVLCRSVRDAAAMLDAVALPMPGDPFVIVQPAQPYLQQLGDAIAPLRIAWTARSWQPGSDVDPEVAGCVARAAELCASFGHHVVEDQPAFEYEAFLRTVCVSWAFGFDVEIDQLAKQMGRPIGETTLEPVTLAYYHLTGQPAISLPLGMSAAGLPIGVQFVARFGREDLLLRLARLFEEAVPWRDRRPPLHVARADLTS